MRTLNAKNQLVSDHPCKLTLSPPRFLLHQCTLMKGNAPTINPVMLQKQITTCSAVTKEKAKQKLRNSSAGLFSQVAVFRSKNKIETLKRPMHTKSPRETLLMRPGFLLLTSCAPLNVHNQQDTQRERISPPSRCSANSHRRHLLVVFHSPSLFFSLQDHHRGEHELHP